jgi:hypothetical protein
MDDITEIIVRTPTRLSHDAEQDIAFDICHALLGDVTDGQIGAALDKIKFEHEDDADLIEIESRLT